MVNNVVFVKQQQTPSGNKLMKLEQQYLGDVINPITHDETNMYALVKQE